MKNTPNEKISANESFWAIGATNSYTPNAVNQYASVNSVALPRRHSLKMERLHKAP